VTRGAALTREEAEGLVNHECQLLDERRLDEWLELFTEDGVYWVPTSDVDRPEAASAVYDDALQRKKRVHQLIREPRLAQTPASRTVHFISNLQIDQSDESSDAAVRCNVLIAEVRPASHPAPQLGLSTPRFLAGHCQYDLRREGGRWAIAMKKVLLVDRDLPLFNLTFIL
jgi:3-phenylpropionate/cinnamic acid dioxygenase small subunit